MHSRLVAVPIQFAAVITLAAPIPAVAQQSMSGFWVIVQKDCVPASTRCTGPEVGPWNSHVAITINGDVVTIATPPPIDRPLLVGHVDTLYITGRPMQWLPGHRGITRVHTTISAADRTALGESTTHVLWPGESWYLSKDGNTLTHEYRVTGSRSLRSTWTYRREVR